MLFARSRGEKPNIKSNLCFNEGGLSPAPELVVFIINLPEVARFNEGGLSPAPEPPRQL